MTQEQQDKWFDWGIFASTVTWIIAGILWVWVAIAGITTALGNIEANSQQLQDHEHRVRSIEQTLTEISTDVRWIRAELEDD